MSDEFWTVEAMDERGGSFVRALANCWRYADDANRQTLEVAFSNYFDKFRQIGEQKRERAEGDVEQEARAS